MFDSNGRISPLYIDWAAEILEDRTDLINNKYIISNSTYNVFKKDKLFQLLIQRELLKKSIEINKTNIENLFLVLVDLSVEYKNQYVDRDTFVEICDSWFGIGYADQIAEMTLFESNMNGKIKIKYDLLNILIPARFLLRHIIDNNLISENIIDILSLYWNGKNESGHMEEISKSMQSYLPGSERINSLLSNVIDHMKDDLKKGIHAEKRLKKIRKAVSGTLHLAFGLNDIIDMQSTSDLLRTLFKNDLSYISIYGNFPKINFADFEIFYGYFYQFDNFKNCSFPIDKTIFFDCIFDQVRVGNNKKISSSLFDSKSIFIDSDVKDAGLKSDEIRQQKKDKAKDFFVALVRYIGFGEQSRNRIKQNVNPKPRDLEKLLDYLSKENFLGTRNEKGKSRHYYLSNISDLEKITMRNFGSYEEFIEKISKEM